MGILYAILLLREMSREAASTLPSGNGITVPRGQAAAGFIIHSIKKMSNDISMGPIKLTSMRSGRQKMAGSLSRGYRANIR
jgi:hypothetical protein